MEFKWDREGNPKDNVNSLAAALITTWPGMLYDSIGDHLTWGLMTASRVLDPELIAHRGSELVDAVANAAKRWHPALQALIKLTDPATAAATPTLVSRPLSQWEATEVTLIGGASYVRIPDPGVGVTAALRGAATLCRLLAEAATERRPVVAAIREYETQILQSGFATSRAYSRCLNRKARMNGGVMGPVLAVGTLTRLRAANRIPGLRRRIAGEFSWLQGGTQGDLNAAE